MDDIAPELLEKIRKVFRELMGEPEAPADYAEAAEYADRVGDALSEAFGRCVSGESLPDGRMYWNIADRVVRPMLEEDHALVSEAAANAQRILNESAGLNLKAQTASLDESRVEGILNKLSAAEQFDDVAWVLDEPVRTFSRSVVDDTLRANVTFQGKAGLRPKIVRRAEAKCCEWCSRLAGTYSYPDVPNDVYRRHERCRCSVEYDPGSGRRQSVHTKQWTESEERDTIEARKQIEAAEEPRPLRILRAEGAALGTEGGTVRIDLGTLDPDDRASLDAMTQLFCENYASSPVENMLVVTKDGHVYFMTDNKPAGVDCSYLGDRLRGSYNIHTHPPDQTQFSFSTDVDLPAFFEDGSAVMEAVDYKYRYRFERPEGVTFEEWDAVRYQVEKEIGTVASNMGFDFDTYAENYQHALIEETCNRLGIHSYSRRDL